MANLVHLFDVGGPQWSGIPLRDLVMPRTHNKKRAASLRRVGAGAVGNVGCTFVLHQMGRSSGGLEHGTIRGEVTPEDSNAAMVLEGLGEMGDDLPIPALGFLYVLAQGTTIHRKGVSVDQAW